MPSAADVAKHNRVHDCWIIIGNEVFDVTKFLRDGHPGGKKVIMKYAGKDATKEFDKYHSRDVIEEYIEDGTVCSMGKLTK